MSSQRTVKYFFSWTFISIIIGIGVGVGTSIYEMGHMGAFTMVLIFAICGAVYGLIGGAIFAPLFSWLEPHLPARSVRAGAAVILGMICGLIGIYLVLNTVDGIAFTYTVGSLSGALIGIVCMIISVSECGRDKEI
jgi:hypothetical protein